MTTKGSWPLYEVFVRGKRGLNHVHVGSIHAAGRHGAVAALGGELAFGHRAAPSRGACLAA